MTHTKEHLDAVLRGKAEAKAQRQDVLASVAQLWPPPPTRCACGNPHCGLWAGMVHGEGRSHVALIKGVMCGREYWGPEDAAGDAWLQLFADQQREAAMGSEPKDVTIGRLLTTLRNAMPTTGDPSETWFTLHREELGELAALGLDTRAIVRLLDIPDKQREATVTEKTWHRVDLSGSPQRPAGGGAPPSASGPAKNALCGPDSVPAVDVQAAPGLVVGTLTMVEFNRLGPRARLDGGHREAVEGIPVGEARLLRHDGLDCGPTPKGRRCQLQNILKHLNRFERTTGRHYRLVHRKDGLVAVAVVACPKGSSATLGG